MFTLNLKREEELRKIITRYPNVRAALLPALWLVQEEAGFVSDEAIEYVARELDISAADVYGTVTFYTMFNRRKIGRHHIQVCRNICCWLRGSEQILEYLKAKLGIDVKETTKDGMFTLGTVECLGACGTAPVMQIDNEYYENLTQGKIDSILENVIARRVGDEAIP